MRELVYVYRFFFSSRRRHTRYWRDWSSDVCSSDLIQVGAATEVAMKEKKARVEDALHACRAAVEEGILPGGGVAVIRAAAKVLDGVAKKGANDDQRIGVEIVRRAIEAPIKQIAENAGVDGGVVSQKVKESKDTNFGYNALTHEY